MFRQSVERYDQGPKGRVEETNDANDWRTSRKNGALYDESDSNRFTTWGNFRARVVSGIIPYL